MSMTGREVIRHALHKSRLERQLLDRLRISRNQDIGHLNLGDRRQVFAHVYDQGVWKNGRPETSLSGRGSQVAATSVLRSRLPRTLHDIGAKSLLDIGCGDFTWMQQVDLSDFLYTGLDIVPSVIYANKSEFGSQRRRFLCNDAVNDDLPYADAVLCREILFHLSFCDGQALLRNIKRTGAKYLIATSDRATLFNADIRTGDYRPLNLNRRPYKLLHPKLWIDDDAVVAGRVLGVWDLI